MQRIAYYAISGDPVTYGHLWVIEQAAEMYDKLYVALAVNPGKTYTFSFADREDMLARSLSTSLMGKRVVVTAIKETEFTVKAARRSGAAYLVRGVRDAHDFDYEMKMAHFNAKLEPTVLTVFLPTPTNFSQVSSSFVKGLVGLEGWEDIIRGYVPEPVQQQLVAWHQSRLRKGA